MSTPAPITTEETRVENLENNENSDQFDEATMFYFSKSPFYKLLNANASETDMVAFVKSKFHEYDPSSTGLLFNYYFLLCVTESFKRGYKNCIHALFTKLDEIVTTRSFKQCGQTDEVLYQYWKIYQGKPLLENSEKRDVRPHKGTISYYELALFLNNNGALNNLFKIYAYKKGDINPLYMKNVLDLKEIERSEYLLDQCEVGNFSGVLKALLFGKVNINARIIMEVSTKAMREDSWTYPLYIIIASIIQPGLRPQLASTMGPEGLKRQTDFLYIRQVMLQHGASKELALLTAVRHQDTVSVIQLICLGDIDVNCRDEEGCYTPLMLAVRYGDIHTVSTLMSAPHINKDLKDTQGRTAKDLAAALPKGHLFIQAIDNPHPDSQLSLYRIFYNDVKNKLKKRDQMTDLERQELAREAEEIIPRAVNFATDEEMCEILEYIMVHSGTKTVKDLFVQVPIKYWETLLKRKVKLDLSITDRDGKTLLRNALEYTAGAAMESKNAGDFSSLVHELLEAAPLRIQGKGYILASLPTVQKDEERLQELQYYMALETFTKNRQIDSPQDKYLLSVLAEFGRKAKLHVDQNGLYGIPLQTIQSSTELVRKIRKRLINPKIRALSHIIIDPTEFDFFNAVKTNLENEVNDKTLTVSDIMLLYFNASKEVQTIEEETEIANEERELKQTKSELMTNIYRIESQFYQAKPNIEECVGVIEKIREYLKTAYEDGNTFIGNLSKKKNIDKRELQLAQNGYNAKKEGLERLVKEYDLACEVYKKFESGFENLYKDKKAKIEKCLEENDIKSAQEHFESLAQDVLKYTQNIETFKTMISSFKDVLAGIRTFTEKGKKKYNPGFKPKSDRERTAQSQQEEKQITEAASTANKDAKAIVQEQLDRIEKEKEAKIKAEEQREKDRLAWKEKLKARKLEKDEEKRCAEIAIEKQRIAEQNIKAALAANCPNYSSKTYTPHLESLKQSSNLQNHPKIAGLPVYNHLALIEQLLSDSKSSKSFEFSLSSSSESSSSEYSDSLILDRERDALKFAIADLFEFIRKLPNGFVIDADLAADFRHFLYKGSTYKMASGEEDLKLSDESNEQLHCMVKNLLQILRERSSGKSELKALSEEELLVQMKSPLFSQLLQNAKKLPPKKERPIPSEQELLADIDTFYQRLTSYKKMNDNVILSDMAEKYCVSMLGVLASLIRDNYRECYHKNKIIYDQYIEDANQLRHGQTQNGDKLSP